MGTISVRRRSVVSFMYVDRDASNHLTAQRDISPHAPAKTDSTPTEFEVRNRLQFISGAPAADARRFQPL